MDRCGVMGMMEWVWWVWWNGAMELVCVGFGREYSDGVGVVGVGMGGVMVLWCGGGWG